MPSRYGAKQMKRLELEAFVRNNVEDNLMIETNEKGHGVLSTTARVYGDFVCEYTGDLISYEQAIEREHGYKQDKEAGSFLYLFKFSEKKYCIDATGTSVLTLKEFFFFYVTRLKEIIFPKRLNYFDNSKKKRSIHY